MDKKENHLSAERIRELLSDRVLAVVASRCHLSYNTIVKVSKNGGKVFPSTLFVLSDYLRKTSVPEEENGKTGSNKKISGFKQGDYPD